MSRSRLPLYLGLTAAGAGGYYLYKSGGDVDAAKARAKADAEKARAKLPHTSEAEHKGKEIGNKATAYIDEIVDSAHAKAKDANARAGEGAKESIEKIEKIRQDTAKQMGTTVDKLDRAVEEKASEAKKSISGWFGGSK
ncbi:hypothetical protein TCE0_034r10292 [Talaromyces pinophilus]|uniref:Calcofluor white hypersensitive protein n=1 Tax=Talaromyces pinophilus TaxID=128442 RepID=A0A6V8HCQ1_TALPI|nr:Hypothetical protein PENO1_079950 [Penicillium occitanis (nom. inval.)]PCG94414.1 hypothetical protein PENOC_082770 [Penicillium occitanis (nom. inval.)]GAM39061.1 hypothetical protein TCE0_034r10292 [Talaromyces pinophilus]